MITPMFKIIPGWTLIEPTEKSRDVHDCARGQGVEPEYTLEGIVVKTMNKNFTSEDLVQFTSGIYQQYKIGEFTLWIIPDTRIFGYLERKE